MDTQTLKEIRGPGREGIKCPWLSDKQIRDIAGFLSSLKNRENHIIFGLLLCTGQKFSRLAKVQWDSYNARLRIIRVGDRAIKLTESVATGIEGLRQEAKGESEPIIKMKYKKFWQNLETACDRLGIEPSGVLSLRNTFAMKHWQTHNSRSKLMDDLGLTTLRSLPKEIFQTRPAPSLFNGVL